MISLNHYTFLSFLISIVFAVLTLASVSAQQQQELKPSAGGGVGLVEGVIEDENNLMNNKRGWKDVSGSWGKRGWGDLQGTWGKRAWDRLNGAWGKRLSPVSTDDRPEAEEIWNSIEKRPEWNKFKGSWGKRAAGAQGWSNLRGLWGKRSWNNKLGNSWGKRSDFDDGTSNANDFN